MKGGWRLAALVVLLASAHHTDAQAQDVRGTPRTEEAAPIAPVVAKAPDAGAGEVGRRQGKDVAARAGLRPMARVNNRIANRVQSRLRNRIDDFYDPRANSTSPFRVASDQARVAGRPR